MRGSRMVLLAALAAPFPDDPPQRVVREPSPGGQSLVIAGVGLPNGVAARPDEANPIIPGKNLYAPDIVKNGGAWNLYYGGWRDPSDLHDQIYAAVADGPTPAGPWKGQQVVITQGRYNHVNDPSVVRRGPDDWFMAFTVAEDGGREGIAVATSRDGLAFSPKAPTPADEVSVSGGDFVQLGRPTLSWTGTGWKLWFDGSVRGGGRHSYLAECADRDPKRFRLVHEYADIDGFPGFMEPDVERVGGKYVAVVQRSFAKLVKLESKDGVHFDEVGVVLEAADPALARKTISNPSWISEGPGGPILGVAFGMTDVEDLTRQSIGFGFHQLAVRVTSPPDVVHLFARSRGFDAAVPITFQHAQFSRIRVEDPKTGGVIAEADVDAKPGDL